jgi:hypothetical protein
MNYDDSVGLGGIEPPTSALSEWIERIWADYRDVFPQVRGVIGFRRITPDGGVRGKFAG